MNTKTLCDTKGHKYYPAVRRVTDLFAISRDENIIYCARCGEVRSLDTATPYWRSTDYGTWSISSGTTYTSGWTFLGDIGNSGTNTKV